MGPKKPARPTTAERTLRDHIPYMEKRLYGLTNVDVRRLAYDLAENLGLKQNISAETKMAGRDWLHGFFKRHEDLAIRRPQAQGTNIARAVGFNRPKVHRFFELYRSQLETSIYTPTRIWNMDETGATNVPKPGKIVTTKGVRQAGKLTSGERGATVTVTRGMNAVGTSLPLMFIFPRRRMMASLLDMCAVSICCLLQSQRLGGL